MKKRILILLISICASANAQYINLLNFSGVADGSDPYGSLVSDGTFLYGTTQVGGTNNLGTLFKIKPDGTGYSKLFDFAGTSNGSHPISDLVSDGTFFYGTTEIGGTNNIGTLFKIKPDGTGFSKLLDFTGASNGNYPSGSLFFDGTFLYGMTYSGGVNSMGTIFKIKPDGTGYSKLLDFDGPTNGSYPDGSFISDGTFLYGTTEFGGTNNMGTLFRILPDGSGYNKLLDFAGSTNGRVPLGSLISDGTFLYGMTYVGGINDSGTVFKIMPNGSGYSKLLDFASVTNGSNPYGSLFFDGTFLLGMTFRGGTSNLGTLFKIKPDGSSYSKLIDFAGTTNGSYPYGSLISDGTFLYGMTHMGGTNNLGTIFKFSNVLTGIKEDNVETGFTIFPNPMSEQTVLKVGNHLKNATLKVYNSLGQLVKQMDNLAGQTIIFHRDDLPNGLYFIHAIQSNNVISINKLVIADN